jgi:hypothetical protein
MLRSHSSKIRRRDPPTLANSNTQTGVVSDGDSLVTAVPGYPVSSTVLVEYTKVDGRLRIKLEAETFSYILIAC